MLGETACTCACICVSMHRHVSGVWWFIYFQFFRPESSKAINTGGFIGGCAWSTVLAVFETCIFLLVLQPVTFARVYCEHDNADKCQHPCPWMYQSRSVIWSADSPSLLSFSNTVKLTPFFLEKSPIEQNVPGLSDNSLFFIIMIILELWGLIALGALGEWNVTADSI